MNKFLHESLSAQSSEGYLNQQIYGSTMNRNDISFQTNPFEYTSEMIPMGNYYGIDNINGMGFPSTLNVMSMNLGAHRPGSSSSSFRRDSESHLAIEWSSDEQYKLEEGLVRYANEPSMMRYIKIAATLSDKTVRDVTMRCRWMTRKRRKVEDQNPGKKLRKDKVPVMRSNSRMNTFSSPPPPQLPPPGPPAAAAAVKAPVNMMASHPNPIINNYQIQNQMIMPCGPFDATKYLLEQNNNVLGQISSNISTFELQDNADLFSRSRNNITDIQNRMSSTPGLMSQMPQLPVLVNDELADNILMYSNMPEFDQQLENTEFGLLSGMDLKHEPWMLLSDC